MNRIRPWRSIRFTLPARIVAGAAVVLLGFGTLSYVRLAGHLEAEATRRLSAVADQLKAVFDSSAVNLANFAGGQASQPAYTGLVEGAPEWALEEAADYLVTSLGSAQNLLQYQFAGPDGCVLVLRRVDGELLRDENPTEHCLDTLDPPTNGPINVGPLVVTEGGIHSDLIYNLSRPTEGSESTEPEVSAEPTDVYGTVRFSVEAGSDVEALRTLIADDSDLLLGAFGGTWSDLSSARELDADTLGLGDHRYVDGEGEIRLASVRAVDGLPWIVWVERQRSAVLAPAADLRRGLFLGGTLSLLAIGLLTVSATNRFTTKLRSVAESASALAAGDRSRRVGLEPVDEFGVLGTSFDEMADSIEESHDLLEERVRKRTSELEAAIRDLKQLQAQLLRKERLAVLGELAGGVGHELRNPLGVMQNSVYLLGRLIEEPPEKVARYLRTIEEQVDLATNIVDNLLELGRVRPPVRERLELHTLVETQLARLGRRGGIEVEVAVPEGLEVLGDPGQLGQVVFNVLENAAQSLEGEGRLTISSERVDEVVELSVRDTGPGIPAELRERIFEPLFTTKARGIGLGLALSRTLAQNNGGAIELTESGPQGSVFSIRIPAVGSLAGASV